MTIKTFLLLATIVIFTLGALGACKTDSATTVPSATVAPIKVVESHHVPDTPAPIATLLAETAQPTVTPGAVGNWNFLKMLKLDLADYFDADCYVVVYKILEENLDFVEAWLWEREGKTLGSSSVSYAADSFYYQYLLQARLHGDTPAKFIRAELVKRHEGRSAYRRWVLYLYADTGDVFEIDYPNILRNGEKYRRHW